MSRPMKRSRFLAGLALLTLAGCGSVLESGKPARHEYLLRPPSAPATDAVAGAPSLVLSVSAVPGLDTDRILVLGDDARLNPVANAHWADNLPEVFRSVARRSLADSGRFTGVGVGGMARPDEWQLDMELQAFYGEQDAAGRTERVRLRLEASLRCGGNRERLMIEEQAPADASSVAELVAAHQRVTDAALRPLPDRIVAICGG